MVKPQLDERWICMNKSEMLKKTAHIEGMLRGLVEQVSTLSTDVNSSLQAARRLESSLMEKEKAAKEEEEKRKQSERLREYLEQDSRSGVYVSDASEQVGETVKEMSEPEKTSAPVAAEKTAEKPAVEPVAETVKPEPEKPQVTANAEPGKPEKKEETAPVEKSNAGEAAVADEGRSRNADQPKRNEAVDRPRGNTKNQREGARNNRQDSDERSPRQDGRNQRTDNRNDNRGGEQRGDRRSGSRTDRPDRRNTGDRPARSEGMDKDAPARPNQHQQSSRNQGGRGGIAGDTAARPKPARTPEKSSGYVRSYDNDGKAKSKKTIMKETAPSVRGWDDDGQSYGGRKRKTKQQEQPQRKPEPVVIEKAIITTETITVRDFSEKIGKPATEIIKKLFMMGIAANINQDIDFDTCELVAMDYNIELEHQVAKTAEEAMQESADEADAEENLIERPPVVTIMGHVDHGKTSLLDAIRDSAITEGEAGGITQHIGAYTVNCNGRTITFIDTPGHAAFTSMRARGAQVTDVVILVVAADDGIMPQTVEAINHAKAAEVPIVVAINKIDKPEANPDRIKQQLTEYGLVCDDWGGDTFCVPISAKKRTNLDKLLETVLFQADVLELRANPNRAAKGTIIEAKLDRGRGPIATVLVQNGTLKVGDPIVAGVAYGKVRAMMDDKGKLVKSAGPSQPVEVLGFNEVPAAGDVMNVAEVSKKVAEERRDRIKAEQLKSMSKVSLEDLFSHIAEGEMKTLNIVVKADVHGSVEAVRQALEKLSNEEVRVKVIHGGVGAISESDVTFASASNAIVIGFNVRPDSGARALATQEKVDVRTYRIIYQAIEDVENAMKGMFKPVYKEVHLGTISVRNTFKVSGVGVIAGAYVQEGKVQRSALVRVVRDGVVIHEGQIASLRRFKDDVKEVAAGYECGIGIQDFNDIHEGDAIEVYFMEQVQR